MDKDKFQIYQNPCFCSFFRTTWFCFKSLKFFLAIFMLLNTIKLNVDNWRHSFLSRKHFGIMKRLYCNKCQENTNNNNQKVEYCPKLNILLGVRKQDEYKDRCSGKSSSSILILSAIFLLYICFKKYWEKIVIRKVFLSVYICIYINQICGITKILYRNKHFACVQFVYLATTNNLLFMKSHWLK